MTEGFVRPALPDDAGEVARIQLTTWRTAYAAVVPGQVLASLGDDLVAAQWRSAIEAPPTPRHRVLVAVEGAAVVGFAATGPAEEEDVTTVATDGGPDAGAPRTSAGSQDGGPDGDADGDPAGSTLAISALLVEPRWGRRGHGSRLLAAVVDLARADGFGTGVTWVLDADAASRAFFDSAGWAPDGIGRVLDMDGTPVHETRLATSLAEDPAASAG